MPKITGAAQTQIKLSASPDQQSSSSATSPVVSNIQSIGSNPATAGSDTAKEKFACPPGAQRKDVNGQLAIVYNDPATSPVALGRNKWVVDQNDEIIKKLYEITKDMDFVMVVAGFGKYAKGEDIKVKKTQEHDYDEAIKKYGKDKVMVVSGATAIDICNIAYDLAKTKGFRTYGIVSQQAERENVKIAENCDAYISTPAEEGQWQVLNKDGQSYMVAVAIIAKACKFIAYGGGDVTCSETISAIRSGVPTQIYPEFKPMPKSIDPQNLPDLTPVRTKFVNAGL